ncbi:UDP-glucose/GDP-mannose dehydrogenase family protein [Patescibacteria group bacterium]|nr:UDP-glucose/GDP-mannose dehydrogenase family protein [Patescibacteria group bacterium]
MSKTHNICMVGTGYVGLVTGAGLAKLGHTVTCVDIDAEKITGLQEGQIPFYEEDLPKLVSDGIYAGRLRFTTNLEEGTSNAQFVFVAVATPQSKDGEPDLSQLFTAVDDLSNLIMEGTTIVVKSTVPIGCFDDLNATIQSKGLDPSHYELVACPEFLAEGSAVHDFFHPTRTIVGAECEKAARKVIALFDGVSGPRVITNIATAQMIKYASNSFLASRIAFINNVALLAEQHGVDIHHVEQGMLLDARFGNSYLRAGIGYGGPCLSKDLAALIHTAKIAGIEAIALSSIAAQNSQQLQHTINMLCDLATKGETVAIFGLSFKQGTSDVRSSLSLKIIHALTERGRLVVATDPEAIEYARPLLEIDGVTIKENPWHAAAGSHVQAFLANWSQYQQLDLGLLHDTVARPCIFDGPGLFDPTMVAEAGFSYRGIGRIDPNRLMIVEHPEEPSD